MPETEHYTNLVVGSGEAGKYIAWTLADRLVPFCLFTDPELARVGLNEREARKRGIEYRVAKMPMRAVLRARTLSETRGFLKMLIEEHSNKILGFTVFGAEGGELMAVVQTAMLNDVPFPSLRDTIFTHPTMAEGLTSLLADVEVRAEARTASAFHPGKHDAAEVSRACHHR